MQSCKIKSLRILIHSAKLLSSLSSYHNQSNTKIDNFDRNYRTNQNGELITVVQLL